MTFDRVDDVVIGRAFMKLPAFVPAFDTYVKLEALNPSGSIKIKTAREMVLAAEADGLIRPGSRLIESTSGNLGIALATIAAARGYRVTLVTDPNASARSVRFMRALGAEVIVVDRRDANGGFLQRRIELIHRMLDEDPELVWLNQYANPANVRAHSRNTAPEILAGFGEPDWLFIGTGTGGTLMGCVQHLREVGAHTTIVAVDAAGSVTFGGPPAPRLIPGIGTSRRPEIVHDDGSFRKVWVAEEDTIAACRQVARRYGLLLGGSSGSALAAVRALSVEIHPGSQVMAIAPDSGDGYLDTVYSDEWVAERFGPQVLARVTEQEAVLGHA